MGPEAVQRSAPAEVAQSSYFSNGTADHTGNTQHYLRPYLVVGDIPQTMNSYLNTNDHNILEKTYVSDPSHSFWLYPPGSTVIVR